MGPLDVASAMPVPAMAPAVGPALPAVSQPFFGAVGILFVLAGLLSFVLQIAAAIHVLVRDDMEDLQKLVWILLVVFVPFLWLVYFLLGKERTGDIFDDL